MAALAVLVIPASANADGDPASDVLLTKDLYLPFFPPPSKPLAATLSDLLVRTRKNGYRMKVAVIETQGDLGAYPNLFNEPQKYTNLLSQEISFAIRNPHLLVVMPGGFGGQNLGTEAGQTLGEIKLDPAEKSDGLTRSAIHAVATLATANGHPTPVPKVEAVPDTRGSSSSHSIQYVGAALFALVGLGLALVLSRRRRSSVG